MRIFLLIIALLFGFLALQSIVITMTFYLLYFISKQLVFAFLTLTGTTRYGLILIFLFLGFNPTAADHLSDTSTYNERELLMQLATGSETAFSRIFEKYRDELFSYARYLTKSVSSSEEIVQDVFLKLWLSRTEVSNIDHLSSYLRTITRNHTLNVLKRQAHEQQIIKEMGRKQDDTHNSTEDTIRFNEYRKIIQQAIDALTPQQKQVYQLSRNEGLKADEIAQQLQIAPGTVKAHLVQALKTLRTYLGQKIDSGTLVIIYIIMRL